jgi:hypothetical protein
MPYCGDCGIEVKGKHCTRCGWKVPPPEEGGVHQSQSGTHNVAQISCRDSIYNQHSGEPRAKFNRAAVRTVTTTPKLLGMGLLALLGSMASITGFSIRDVIAVGGMVDGLTASSAGETARASIDLSQPQWAIVPLAFFGTLIGLLAMWAFIKDKGYARVSPTKVLEIEERRLLLLRVDGPCPDCADRDRPGQLRLRKIQTGSRTVKDHKGEKKEKAIMELRFVCSRFPGDHRFRIDPA